MLLARAIVPEEADDAQLACGFLLHDVGKLSVPDAVLNKPGPLDEDEWEVMRRHPEQGAKILSTIPFLDRALDVVRHHHERWDGAGYPAGLRGDSASGHGPAILVAEDNVVNQAVAEGMLLRRGHPVQIARDGREAVQAVFDGTYAAVFMDCQMPEMDGYEATREIRRREGDGPHIPIIAMTAHSMKGDRERCLAAGMDDYVSKPLRAEALDAVLARWVAPPGGEEPSNGAHATNGHGPEGPLDLEALEQLRTELAGLGPGKSVDPLIRQFLELMPGRVDAMTAAAERGDLEELEREAHGLKGSSATLGAVRLATACAALEQAGADGDLARALTLVAELVDAAGATRVALEASLDAPTAAPRPL
jgi:CheY-like chemotaxis protein